MIIHGLTLIPKERYALDRRGDRSAAPMLLFYAFPASFSARNTFSGLSGNVKILTPTALKIALAMAAIGGKQAISTRLLHRANQTTMSIVHSIQRGLLPH